MPRYYARVRGAAETLGSQPPLQRDSLLPDRQAALSWAIGISADLARERQRDRPGATELVIDVSDEQGRCLFTI